MSKNNPAIANDEKEAQESEDDFCSFISTYPEAPFLELVSNDGFTAKIKWKERRKGYDSENRICESSNSNMEHYEVSWQNSDNSPKSVKTPCTEYNIFNLIPGTTYSVWVVQITDKHRSVTSNTLVFDAAPKMPVDIHVNAYKASPSDSLVITFKDENIMPMRYKIVVQPLTSEKPIERESEKRFVLIQDLVPGESYAVQIFAVNGNLKSRAAIYDDIACTCPEIPKKVELQQKPGSLELNWEKLAIKPSFYTVQYQANNVQKTYETKHTVFCLDDLKFATKYRFSVAAVNKAGYSEFSEEKTATTEPAPPTNVRVSTNPDSPKTSFIVEFDDQNPAETTYQVVALSMEGKEMSRIATDAKYTVLENLKPGCGYSVYVIAKYVDLKSKRSFFVK